MHDAHDGQPERLALLQAHPWYTAEEWREIRRYREHAEAEAAAKRAYIDESPTTPKWTGRSCRG